jgi:hypothetical protein
VAAGEQPFLHTAPTGGRYAALLSSSLPFAGLTRHIFFLNCRPCVLGFDASGRRRYFIGRDDRYRCRDGHGRGYGIQHLHGETTHLFVVRQQVYD